MEKIRKLLYDVDAAISLIDSFMIGIESFEHYVSDLKTQSAVERQLVIIGEALAKVKKLEGAPLLKMMFKSLLLEIAWYMPMIISTILLFG